MILQSPGDIIFKIFGFPVYYYGITMAIACFVGVIVSLKIYKKFNPKDNFSKIWDFSPWVLIFGIIGARLYYCMLNFQYYIYNPIEILNIREGGLSIHGAIIAGVIALVFFAKKYELGVFKIFDSFSCGTVLAQSIGRWGNFFNSEAFGLPSDLPLKLYIAPEHRPLEFINCEYFHPTFLYESILDIIIFFILLFVIKNFSTKYSGLTFALYLILYSIARLFVENLRIDSALNIGTLHIAQIISFVMFFIGVALIPFLVKLKKNNQ